VNVNREVLEVANSYLTRWKRSGPDNILGICPFHRKADGSEERTPSFTMSLSKGVYLCFSCHERGNLISFLKGVGVSSSRIDVRYGTLIEELAKQAPAPPDPANPDLGQSIRRLPESLLGVFRKIPADLISEGFNPKLLKDLEVGFDSTHSRIVFPLRDLYGVLVGISGRATLGDYPRYKIYDKEYAQWGIGARYGLKKSKFLWNAHRVYPEAFHQDNPLTVLVEGFKACIWVLQSGISNVVALMGSYLSFEQQWMLERLGGTVCLMLDNNPAGFKGTHLTGRKLSKKLRVTVADYPGEQPDHISEEAVHKSIANAEPFYRWYGEHIDEITERSSRIEARRYIQANGEYLPPKD
jgi:DNA primase